MPNDDEKVLSLNGAKTLYDDLRGRKADDNVVVKVTPQSLTTAQKLQAIANLGLTDNVVRRYGFKRAKANSNTATRITYLYDAADMTPAKMNFTTGAFEWGSWKDFIESFIRPVMLKNDGTVDYELDHDDQTKKLDGTASDVANSSYAGNAMVEFADTFKWVKRYEDSAYEYVIFSNVQFDSDYKCFAHTNSSGHAMPAFYYGMFFGSVVDGKMRSLATGSNSVNTTREQEITYAKANGTGYYTITKSQWEFICDLLTLLGKDDNTQAVFGAGRSTVSSAAAPGTLKDKGCFWGDEGGSNCVKVLWIENFWGNIWQGIAGFILDGANGIKTKMTPPYCDTPVSAADYSTYTETGVKPGGTSGNYISEEVVNENGFLPKTMSGTATTYMADACWFNNGQVDYGIVGGSWGDSSLDGSRAVALCNLASYARSTVGSRLSYLPE